MEEVDKEEEEAERATPGTSQRRRPRALLPLLCANLPGFFHHYASSWPRPASAFDLSHLLTQPEVTSERWVEQCEVDLASW